MDPNSTAPSAPIAIERLQHAAEVLRVVAHPVRLRIIDQLKNGERTVSELFQAIGTTQSYMSQQLGLMKAKGVVHARRDGNQVHYALTNLKVVEIIHCICLRDNDAEHRPTDPVEPET
ncbi:MAG: hypothetical protein AUK55_15920 [Syntrophobacteraceae bacterium CG2_30_61_12]|nr:MAG: hypothetical protein AUK55_15920 [Syntrophobacteraceae bacterium CG2_30_61_12]